jgi:cyanophycinase
MNRGHLILIGGAEDKDGDRSLLAQILETTRAEKIVIIPTASAYPGDIERNYCGAFNGFGIPEARCLKIRKASEADTDEHLEAVENTDLVYFSGGDQVRLVSRLMPTKLFDRIRTLFAAGTLHIAGTSAGASAAGNPLIYDGDRKGFLKGSIRSMAGFGLIDGVTIDTHFSARKRLARLSQFLLSGGCEKGIGLDENTGIFVFPNDTFSVIGTGMVTLLDSGGVTGSNYDAAGQGERLRFNGMRIGFLPAGSRFSIRKWEILN